MPPVQFELNATDPTGARTGVLHTRRGDVPTPAFMPVATHAAFRHVSTDEAADSGAGMLLANTYHLMLRPGREVFERMGGIHDFMQWRGPVLTDSGGFQIFSLPDDRSITEKGAHFRSFHDNSRQLLSPETSILMQQAIGAEVMMVLDVCIHSTANEVETREAMERTHRWAVRSLEARDRRDTGQALFGIVQGGVFPQLREQSAEFLTQLPFEGFAVGGLAVGEGKEEREAMTAHTTAMLPPDKPRYLMGVGTPGDLLEGVRRGIDMFDCIIPTKMAQQGYAYTFDGLVRITRQTHRFEEEPLDAECDCSVCTRYSRAYLQHLQWGKHALGSRLLSLHNLRHYQLVMARVREAVREGRFAELYAGLKSRWAPKLTRKKNGKPSAVLGGRWNGA